jgi:periplasmic copper chaperone A
MGREGYNAAMKSPIKIACAVLGMVMVMVLESALARAEILASGGWSRETVPGARMGVGYVVIQNTGGKPRKLLRITTTVTDSVQLHQSSVDAQGMAHMWPMGTLELGPGETVRFEPNGRHLMFVDLNAPLKAGTHIPLTLEFDGGEKAVTVQLEVRPLVGTATGQNQAGHAHN